MLGDKNKTYQYPGTITYRPMLLNLLDTKVLGKKARILLFGDISSSLDSSVGHTT